KANDIYIVNPNTTITKNIEIPSLDPNEIKSIIDLQAGRHTPYSREEIIIDYVNIGVYQRNYSKVLLVIVNRNVLKNQLLILEQSGLVIEKVFFTSENIARFYSKALNLVAAETPTGIINVTANATDFTVAFKGTVIACRNIPVGAAQLIAEGQPARDKFISELKKSIESYQSEDIEKAPDTFVLTSDHSYLKDLQPFLKESLSNNVKIVPYFDNLKIDPMARKVIAETNGESFLDVLSPILAFDESRIDLMPEELRLQRTLEGQRKELTKLGVFAIIFLILVGVIFFSKVQTKNSFLIKLKNTHEPKRKEAQVLEKISSKTRIVKDYLNGRMIGLEALNELYRLVPEEIYLSSISMDDQGVITIQGTSESMSRVFSLVTDLENSDLFKGVKTKSTTAKKERGKDVAAFEVAFRLESAKDEEIAAEEEGGVPVEQAP
ncbi:MAG: PilN domain-containing protein, partial [Candidatus Omnitrophota bacterium]